jgi:hypothetical protein
MALYGHDKQEGLSSLLHPGNDIPSQDTFRPSGAYLW